MFRVEVTCLVNGRVVILLHLWVLFSLQLLAARREEIKNAFLTLLCRSWLNVQEWVLKVQRNLLLFSLNTEDKTGIKGPRDPPSL